MKFTHGITIYNDDDPEEILHFVGFESKPTAASWDMIREEMESGEWEFTNEYDWTMRESTQEEIDFYNDIIAEHEKFGRHKDFNVEVHGETRH